MFEFINSSLLEKKVSKRSNLIVKGCFCEIQMSTNKRVFLKFIFLVPYLIFGSVEGLHPFNNAFTFLTKLIYSIEYFVFHQLKVVLSFTSLVADILEK